MKNLRIHNRLTFQSKPSFFFTLGFIILSLGQTVAQENTTRGNLILKLSSNQPAINRHFDIQMDPHVCGNSMEVTEVIRGRQGELAQTLAWLEGDNLKNVSFTLTTPPSLSISQCKFENSFVFLKPQSLLSVTSRDSVNYDLQFKLPNGKTLHRSLPPNLKEIQIDFEKPGIVEVSCNLHPWMKAFIVLPSHAFFEVTDAHGEVSFDSVPAGSYTLHLWHQTLGRKTYSTPIQITKGNKRLNLNWEDL